MALYLDPKTPVRLEAPGQAGLPESKRIAYLVAVPTRADGVRLDREIAVAGGRRHAPLDLCALLRRGVEKSLTAEGDAALRGTLLDRIAVAVEAYRGLGEAALSSAGAEDAEGMEAFGAAVLAVTDAEDDLSDIAAMMRAHYPPYGRAVADNETYAAVQGLVAAKMFVVGWENMARPCKRGMMGLDDASMQAIPPHHLAWLGWEVRRLSQPTEAEVGESVSPSPSPSSTVTSTAKSKPPRKTRSKATAGHSPK